MNRTVRLVSGAWLLLKNAPVRANPIATSSALTCTLKFPVTVTGASGLWNSASNISRSVHHRNDRRGWSRGSRRSVHNIVHVAGRQSRGRRCGRSHGRWRNIIRPASTAPEQQKSQQPRKPRKHSNAGLQGIPSLPMRVARGHGLSQ